jgi:hypothetical protein
MANIAKRSDGRWRARYRDTRGREHSRHFTRRIDAQRWLDSVTTAVQTGTYVDPALGKVTVALWSERWLAGQAHLKPSTYARYASVVRRHILAEWGDISIVDVSHADVQAWVSRLTAHRSASTARKAHRVLSLMLSLAVRDGRLVKNPADGVGLPREAEKDRRYLTHDEVRELAAACADPPASVTKRRAERGHESADYELAVLFLAYTGVRFGEMAALRVRRLDPLKRRVEIAEAVTSVNGALVWGTCRASWPSDSATTWPDAARTIWSSPHPKARHCVRATSGATCSHRQRNAPASLGWCPTGCDTRPRAWQSRREPTSRSCSRCSGTSRQQ